MKIAVSSSNGKDVDLLFGKSKTLYVYEFNGENTKFFEKREVEIDEDRKHQGVKIVKLLHDVDLVICVQIGFKSKMRLDKKGIKVYQDEGPIDEVLERYVNHYKFMNQPLNI